MRLWQAFALTFATIVVAVALIVVGAPRFLVIALAAGLSVTFFSSVRR